MKDAVYFTGPSLRWRIFQMTVIATTIGVTYRLGLRNPWAGGLLGMLLAWCLTARHQPHARLADL